MITRGALLLFPLFLLLPPIVLPTTVQTGKKEFRIAWMAPRKEYNQFSAATTVNALKLALYAIRKTHLKGYKIRVKWYDSDCNSKSALTSAVDAKKWFEPDLFLGPPCSQGMRPVAQLASHWNIPVFGWVSKDHDLKDKVTYSTLIRVLGPLNQFSSTMRYVSSLFNWSRYAMIHDKDESYKSVYEALAVYASNFFTSTHSVTPSMDDEQIKEIFLQVKKYARIIIFAVPWLTMRKYILVAHRLGLTTGEFAFICINGDVYSGEALEADVLSDRGWRRNDTFDEEAKFAFESVIHVILAGQEQSTYKRFTNLVQKMKAVTSSDWDIPEGSHQLDAYAPFLYDATVLWAIMVNRSLADGGDPKNGSNIFSQAQTVTTKGLTGKLVMDSYCDRLVNIWFLDMQEDGNFDTITKIYNTLDGGMVLSQMENTISVRWPDGTTGQTNAPPDVPKCGFEGEKCQKIPEHKDHGYTDTIIGAAAGASVVIIIAIAVQISHRRYRRKRQLESMLWQVKFEEIDFVTAILCGSVRASFKNLTRRRSSKNAKVITKTRNNVCCADSIESWSDSPRSHHCTETGTTMFGSVAYLRGTLVSVKRMSKNSVNITKEVLLELNQLIELKHTNVCAFVGACVDPGRILLLWEYCAKGSLQDIIWNTNIKLDQLFKFALCQDVAKGLEYIHKSSVNYHGNLKSSNCVVDSRWTCKLTDFGVPKIRSMDKASIPFEENADKELWTAPEILRAERNVDFQKADVYSLGIIMKEVFTRSGPFTEYPFYSSSELITKVREPPPNNRFRPSIQRELRQHPDLIGLIEDCWSEDAGTRPSAPRVVKSLTRINPSKHMTMIDNMIAMLEKYANHLEELVAERTSELDAEKRKTENLLYRMLPQSVAEDLKLGKPVKAEMFDQATIYFSDIVGFTKICGESTPIEVVNLLNCLYTLFDDIITRYDVYKVETIGDAYMIASGLPTKNGDNHIKEIADCAMDILSSTTTFKIPHLPERPLSIRIGIHTGSVVAGVVGLAMPRYCLFGDTVNVASRMESTGLPLKIHMSSVSHDTLVSRFSGYHFYNRGEIPVKGKGTMNTFFLTARDGFHKALPYTDQVTPTSPSCTFDMYNGNTNLGTHTREGSHSALMDVPHMTSTPCKADIPRDLHDSGYQCNPSPGGNKNLEGRDHTPHNPPNLARVTPFREHSTVTVHMNGNITEQSSRSHWTPEQSFVNREQRDVGRVNHEPVIVSHINRVKTEPIDVSHQIVAHMNSIATEPTIISHINLVTSEPCDVARNLHVNVKSEPVIISHINRVPTEPTVIAHINRVVPEDIPNSVVTHVTDITSDTRPVNNINRITSEQKEPAKNILTQINGVISDPTLVTHVNRLMSEQTDVSDHTGTHMTGGKTEPTVVTSISGITSDSKNLTDNLVAHVTDVTPESGPINHMHRAATEPFELCSTVIAHPVSPIHRADTSPFELCNHIQKVATEPLEVSSTVIAHPFTHIHKAETGPFDLPNHIQKVATEPLEVSSTVVAHPTKHMQRGDTVPFELSNHKQKVATEPLEVSSTVVANPITHIHRTETSPYELSSTVVAQPVNHIQKIVKEPLEVPSTVVTHPVTHMHRTEPEPLELCNTVVPGPATPMRKTDVEPLELPNGNVEDPLTHMHRNETKALELCSTLLTKPIHRVQTKPLELSNKVFLSPVTHIYKTETEPVDLSCSVVAHVNMGYEHDEDKTILMNYNKNSHIKSATVPRCTSTRPSVLVQHVPTKVDVDVYEESHKQRAKRTLEMTPL